jgi:hypothetical protein
MIVANNDKGEQAYALPRIHSDPNIVMYRFNIKGKYIILKTVHKSA